MGWGMRVLVVSDTHRKNDLYIALVERLSPDMVVHCGDVEGSAYTIREAAHAECHIVAGNNDFFDSLPEDDEFMIGRYKAYLTHGHHYYISVGTEMLKDEAKARGFDIVFFGHTHRPLIERDENLLIINPGSISYPRQEGRNNSYVLMEVDEDGKIDAKICYIQDDIRL